MSLDTYLPVGRGRYLIGSEPESPGSLILFYAGRRNHLRVGCDHRPRGQLRGDRTIRTSSCTRPGQTPEKIEEGEYSIQKSGRGMRVVELRSGEMIKKYLALGQPGLGRFRFINSGQFYTTGHKVY